MFLKFISYGNFSYDYFYYNYNKIVVYDNKNKIIENLNHENIVNHTFKYRCESSDLDKFFNNNDYVPYESTLPNRAELVLYVPVNSISKIELTSYSNRGGARYVEIYYSQNEKDFSNKYGYISFGGTYEIQNVNNLIHLDIIKYLLKQNNKYYTLKSKKYNICEKDFAENGFEILNDLTKNIDYIKNTNKKIEILKCKNNLELI